MSATLCVYEALLDTCAGQICVNYEVVKKRVYGTNWLERNDVSFVHVL